MMELRTLERLSLSHKLGKQRSFGEGKADGRIKKRSGHNWKKILRAAPGSVATLRKH